MCSLSAGFSAAFNAKRLSIEMIRSITESTADAMITILQEIIQSVSFMTASRAAPKEAIRITFFADSILLLK